LAFALRSILPADRISNRNIKNVNEFAIRKHFQSYIIIHDIVKR
jgi:hypothetical protein